MRCWSRADSETVDLANARRDLKICTQEIAQASGRAGENWCAVGEKDAFGAMIQKLAKRTSHLLFVRAVPAGQAGEPMRRQVNQRVTDDERAAVCWAI